MISSSSLRKLATLGLSSEQMAGVLDLLADQVQADEDRRANQRDRTRKSRASSRDSNVTVTEQEALQERDEACDTVADGFSLSPVPLLPPIPPNNPLTPKPSSKNNQRGTRLPADWTMNGPDLAYALSKNLTEREAIDLFERFCSWAWSASGANAVKINWHQAWQGWVQRDGPKIIAGRRNPSGRPLTAHQTERETGRRILDDLDQFAGSSGKGQADLALLRHDPGDGPAGVHGGVRGDVINLPAGRCRSGG